MCEVSNRKSYTFFFFSLSWLENVMVYLMYKISIYLPFQMFFFFLMGHTFPFMGSVTDEYLK